MKIGSNSTGGGNGKPPTPKPKATPTRRPKRFTKLAKDRMAAFRKTLSPDAQQPNDVQGRKHGHLLALGFEDENLFPALRGDAGARHFFRERSIKWWNSPLCGDRPTDSGDHGPTRNLASSQVACVNFLLPLAAVDGALLAFLRVLDDDVLAVETIVDQAGRRSLVEFEWAGWEQPLEGGALIRGAHNTSVDALIVARTAHGRRAYLLEWKYSEQYLHSEDYGRGASGTTRRSRYGARFAAADSPFVEGAVIDEFLYNPFFQLMRLQLLATQMVKEGVSPTLPVEEARVVVVCPEANTDYRNVVRTLPLAQRFAALPDVQSVMRASLRDPGAFSVVGQEGVVAQLRRSMPAPLAEWLAYHAARYGW